MQIKNILIAMLFFPLSLYGQYSSHPWFYFEMGDTLTVIAKSGLSLREGGSSESRKIETIPFGKGIIAFGNYEGREEIENRSGSWVKVKYKNLEGYVFSGYVTKLKVPNFDVDKLDCHNLAWFEQFVRENVDTLSCKGKKLYKGFDLDGKDWGSSNWEMFTDETVIYHSFGYESEDLIIESTEINMNDVLNLLEFYIEKIKKKCPDYYYMKEGKKLQIDVKKDNEGYIKTIECFDINFIAEKSIYKTVIRLNLWNL